VTTQRMQEISISYARSQFGLDVHEILTNNVKTFVPLVEINPFFHSVLIPKGRLP